MPLSFYVPSIHPSSSTRLLSRSFNSFFWSLYRWLCNLFTFFSFVLSQSVLGFVTECYLLCLTTWCKVLDSLYFGCTELVFGSGGIHHGNSAEGCDLSFAKLFSIFLAILHGNDNSYIFVCFCLSVQKQRMLQQPYTPDGCLAHA